MNRQRSALLVALFTLLASVYMIVYSGFMESGDSRTLFNAVASLYRYGDPVLDLMISERLSETFDPDAPLFIPANVEPLIVLMAQPLYALADRIPGLGLVHTVWVFNVIIAALSACVLHVYALALGARPRTALAAALLFGLGTIIVAYSKTFFREPLTLLTILMCGLAAERARATGYRIRWLAALALAIGAALLTRATAVFALPALILIAAPDLKLPRDPETRRLTLSPRAWRALVAAAALVAATSLFVLVISGAGGSRYDFLERLRLPQRFQYAAFNTYLYSLGGSIWATSPITLLALPGALLLIWQRRPRYAIVAAVMLLSFAYGYANFSLQHWFGGLSWPPRFLVPAVPFLMLAALPALDRALSQRWARGALLALAGFSLWVQFTAVSLRWTAYADALPPEANRLSEWIPGLVELRYVRWVVIPGLWAAQPFDFAWIRAGLPLWPLAFALLACAAGWALWRPPRRARPALLLAWCIVTGFALRALYDTDYEYNASNAPLQQMLADVQRETHSGDILILSNPAYVSFFFNYAKLHDAARPLALPIQPGDRPSPEQPPLIEAENPDLLLKMQALLTLTRLAETHDRLWLLENFGPSLPWSVRPVERWLAAHHYPLRTLEAGPQVRLIEFSTAPAPDPFGFRSPALAVDLRYGDHVRLLGVDLPTGTATTPGAALPVSLVWTTDAPLTRDFTMALFLRAADGAPVAQVDVQPGWGFAPTSGWSPGLPVWDHRALRVPVDTAPGDYQLWVKVYSFDSDFQPVNLPVSGSQALDEGIGVLPLRIHIGTP
jgi:hypothetical protein